MPALHSIQTAAMFHFCGEFKISIIFTFINKVECLVPIHCASSCLLGTKKLPVWDLEVLERVATATLLKKTGQENNKKKVVKSKKLF